jgi:hypothetical protein
MILVLYPEEILLNEKRTWISEKIRDLVFDSIALR